MGGTSEFTCSPCPVIGRTHDRGGIGMQFKSFKGRFVSEVQVVEAYRNLHNGVISLRDARPIARSSASPSFSSIPTS